MSGYKNTLYKLTFPNGMVYIGVSQNVTSRWFGDGSHYKGQKVWEAIQEFGWDNIEKELLLKDIQIKLLKNWQKLVFLFQKLKLVL